MSHWNKYNLAPFCFEKKNKKTPSKTRNSSPSKHAFRTDLMVPLNQSLNLRHICRTKYNLTHFCYNGKKIMKYCKIPDYPRNVHENGLEYRFCNLRQEPLRKNLYLTALAFVGPFCSSAVANFHNFKSYDLLFRFLKRFKLIIWH